MVDAETKKVYEAEQLVRELFDNGATVCIHGSHIELPAERKFGDIASMQAYVDAATRLPSFKRQFPNAGTVKVVRHGAINVATYYPTKREIGVNDSELGRWGMRECVLIHELAHHCSLGSGHGREFRNAFIELANMLMSPETGWLLQTTFWESGLK